MTAAAALLQMPTKLRQSASRRNSPSRLAVERIVLTGFMGSGKTTVGALLAERLGWKFLDLDVEIERRCGMSVPALFADLGESHFRKQEASTLASILGHTHSVIALGGGAPETLGNRLLLEQTPATAVVFLEAPFAVLHDRCTQQASDPGATTRPLLADRKAAEARYEARHRHYERIASLRLETSSLSAEEIVQSLLETLKPKS